MKVCSRCGEGKPPDDFARDRSRRDGRRNICRACAAERHREWRAGKQDHLKQYRRGWELKTRYGLTPEDYDAMLERQLGVCDICLGDNDGRTLHVDHCHGSGRVRGLLCDACNLGLGKFRDCPDALRTAANYLEAAA